MTKKFCTACKSEKVLEDFHKDQRLKSGRRSLCKACENLRARTVYKRYGRKKVIERPNRLKYKYGITSEDFSVMLGSQMNLCKICKCSMSMTSKNSNHCHIDHDHKTGKVRGLLCQSCNQGLGQFKDNPDYLKSAIIYLS